MASLLSTRSGLAGARLAVRPARVQRVQRVAAVRIAASSQYQWLKKEPVALIVGFLGWFAPSNIGVPAFGGNSLFGLFMASIGDNLSHFPTGPALDDKFWLYLISWHVGLFVALTLGQIGVQARKQGYFE